MGFTYRMFTLLQLLQVFQPFLPTCTHFTEIVPRLYHSYLRRNKLSFIRKEVEHAVTTGQYLCCTLKKKAYCSLPLVSESLFLGPFQSTFVFACTVRLHSIYRAINKHQICGEIPFSITSNDR